MVNLGRQETDLKLLELENKIRKIYTEAQKDLQKKLKEYFAAFDKKDAIKRDQLARGVIDRAAYNRWKIGQIIVGNRWKSMLKTVSEDLLNTDQIARNITNGYMSDIYAINMNYSTYEIEKKLSVDTSFVLYDHETVEHILREEPQLLPLPGAQIVDKITRNKVVKWHQGQLQSITLQSIIQGESIPNMATRISKTLCVGNRKAAFRYARTATTNAESAGKMDSFQRISDMGVKVKKTWLAVLDGRTRDAHRELDGVTIDLDEPFVNSIGKIMRPGDPYSQGANIWNCRCGLAVQLDGFERDFTDMSLRNTNKLDGMSYDEWKKAHGKSQNILMPDKVAAIMRARYAREYRK